MARPEASSISFGSAAKTRTKPQAGPASPQPAAHMIKVSTAVPPAEVAARLNVSEDTTTVIRSRRYLLDGRPVETAVSYMPERLGAFSAGRAGRFEGGAARDQDLGDLAGVEVSAAELDGPDAAAAVLGDLPQRITRGRTRSGRMSVTAARSPGAGVCVGGRAGGG